MYREIAPVQQMLRPFLRSFWSLQGLSFAGVVVGVGVLSLVPVIGAPLSAALTLAWYLVVISAATEGVPHPPSADVEQVGGLGGSIGRTLLALFWPVMLVALASILPSSSRGPVVGALAYGVALVVTPACFVRAATASGFFELLDPRAPLLMLLRVPTSYLRMLLLWLAVTLGTFEVTDLLRRLNSQAGLLAVSHLSFVLHLLGLTVSAFVVGWWAYYEAEPLGYRLPAERWIVQVPGAVGRAPLPAVAGRLERREQAANAARAALDGADPSGEDELPCDVSIAALAPKADDGGAEERPELPMDASVRAFSESSGPLAGAGAPEELPSDPSVMAFALGFAPDGSRNSAAPGRRGSGEEEGELPMDHGNLGGARVPQVGLKGAETNELARAVADNDAHRVAEAWAAVVRLGTPRRLPAQLRLDAANCLAAGGRRGRAAEILKSVATDSDGAAAAVGGARLVDLLAGEGRLAEALGVIDALEKVGRAGPELLGRRSALSGGVGGH